MKATCVTAVGWELLLWTRGAWCRPWVSCRFWGIGACLGGAPCEQGVGFPLVALCV